MAINLWKYGGGQTSYNPLPVGTNNLVILSIGEYVLRFKASSTTGALLRVYNGNLAYDQTVTLTNVPTVYELKFTNLVEQAVRLRDTQGKGDIIIDSIELVQKPLPLFTVNGIDGFKSGKWTLHANAVAVDDETLVLNATGGSNHSYIDIPLPSNTDFTLNVDHNGKIGIYDYQSSSGASAIVISSTNKTFTFNTGSKKGIRLYLSNFDLPNGIYTFKRPMLNMGSIPAPYSKKTGDKMVLPVFINNLFKGIYTDSMNLSMANPLGMIQYGTAGTICVTIPIKPNTNYTLKKYGTSNRFAVGTHTSLASGTNAISFVDGGSNTSVTINSGNGAVYLVIYLSTLSEKPALLITEGTTINETVQVNKKPMRTNKARTGLVMDGVSNYVQLPSMTMDAIEIECLIDAVQKAGTWKYVVDARSGLQNGYLGYNQSNIEGLGAGFTKEGTITIGGGRQKVKLKATTPFTDDVKLFANYNGIELLSGILYKVTCYLGGQVVAQYDFENPSNLVADKLIPNAKNLLPSFEDSRWSLHSNFKVLGPNVGRLDATAGSQDSVINIETVIGKNYLLSLETPISIPAFRFYVDLGSTGVISTAGKQQIVFTATKNISELRLRPVNSGTFDFIRPQLYQLDGKEGTIYGKPVPMGKQPKRLLYAKR